MAGLGDRPTATWRTVDVGDWVTRAGRVQDEPLGTKEKFWVDAPDGVRWLFKAARSNSGRIVGEDWAEWLVCRLANLIGVPAAVVEPAEHNGRRGIVSRSVLRPGGRLEHGNELLSQADVDFDGSLQRYNDRYTVALVQVALEGSGPPSGWTELAGQTAFDVWAGYLLLDAWAAGRDRHPRNWAVEELARDRTLAPSFDHGNALGFQEPAERHAELAADPVALDRWARRGVSPHFLGKPRLTVLAAAAADASAATAGRYWRGRLEAVADREVAELLQAVPTSILSEGGRNFCQALLDLNRRRVLDGD